MSIQANQKRLLTQPTSKLAKSQITTLLRKEDAWSLLPAETRTYLYTLLPPPGEGEAPPNPDVHPLTTHYKPYIEEELRRYQEDLKEGREQKKWREEAMQAARDRVEGKFDEGNRALREEWWGVESGKQEEVVEKEGGDERVDGADGGVVEKTGEIFDEVEAADGKAEEGGAGEEVVVRKPAGKEESEQTAA